MNIRITIENRDTEQDIVRDFDTKKFMADDRTRDEVINDMIDTLEENQTYPDDQIPF